MAKTKFYVDVMQALPIHSQELRALTHPYCECLPGNKRYVFGVELPDISAEAVPDHMVSPAREYKPDEEPCSECGEPRFPSPSGMVCKNGHGG